MTSTAKLLPVLLLAAVPSSALAQPLPECALLEAVGLKVEQKYQTSGGLSAQSGAPWAGVNGEFEIITRSLAVRTKAKELATRGPTPKTVYYALLAARNYPYEWPRLMTACAVAAGTTETDAEVLRRVAGQIEK